MYWSTDDLFQGEPSFGRSVEDDCELYKRFDIQSVIGTGRTATVLLAKYNNEEFHNRRGLVAIKRMELVNKEKMKVSIDEFSKLSSLDHEHIVRYYEWFPDVSLRGKGFCMCICMKFYNNGGISRIFKDADVRESKLIVPENFIIELLYQMSDALSFLHGKNSDIIHRDISPNNILMSSPLKLSIEEILNNPPKFVLIDFGFATKLEGYTGFSEAGTYKYMSPEIRRHEPYNHNIDVFSLGTLVCNLMLGGEIDVYEKIRDGEAVVLSMKRALIERGYSEFLVHLVFQMVRIDPKKRISSASLLGQLRRNVFRPSIRIEFVNAMKRLPDELYIVIFSFLDFRFILNNVYPLSRDIYRIVKKYENLLWSMFYRSHFLRVLLPESEYKALLDHQSFQKYCSSDNVISLIPNNVTEEEEEESGEDDDDDYEYSEDEEEEEEGEHSNSHSQQQLKISTKNMKHLIMNINKNLDQESDNDEEDSKLTFSWKKWFFRRFEVERKFLMFDMKLTIDLLASPSTPSSTGSNGSISSTKKTNNTSTPSEKQHDFGKIAQKQYHIRKNYRNGMKLIEIFKKQKKKSRKSEFDILVFAFEIFEHLISILQQEFEYVSRNEERMLQEWTSIMSYQSRMKNRVLESSDSFGHLRHEEDEDEDQEFRFGYHNNIQRREQELKRRIRSLKGRRRKIQKDLIEFIHRKATIYDHLGKYDLAVESIHSAIRQSSSSRQFGSPASPKSDGKSTPSTPVRKGKKNHNQNKNSPSTKTSHRTPATPTKQIVRAGHPKTPIRPTSAMKYNELGHALLTIIQHRLSSLIDNDQLLPNDLAFDQAFQEWETQFENTFLNPPANSFGSEVLKNAFRQTFRFLFSLYHTWFDDHEEEEHSRIGTISRNIFLQSKLDPDRRSKVEYRCFEMIMSILKKVELVLSKYRYKRPNDIWVHLKSILLFSERFKYFATFFDISKRKKELEKLVIRYNMFPPKTTSSNEQTDHQGHNSFGFSSPKYQNHTVVNDTRKFLAQTTTPTTSPTSNNQNFKNSSPRSKKSYFSFSIFWREKWRWVCDNEEIVMKHFKSSVAMNEFSYTAYMYLCCYCFLKVNFLNRVVIGLRNEKKKRSQNQIVDMSREVNELLFRSCEEFVQMISPFEEKFRYLRSAKNTKYDVFGNTICGLLVKSIASIRRSIRNLSEEYHDEQQEEEDGNEDENNLINNKRRRRRRRRNVHNILGITNEVSGDGDNSEELESLVRKLIKMRERRTRTCLEFIGKVISEKHRLYNVMTLYAVLGKEEKVKVFLRKGVDKFYGHSPFDIHTMRSDDDLSQYFDSEWFQRILKGRKREME